MLTNRTVLFLVVDCFHYGLVFMYAQQLVVSRLFFMCYLYMLLLLLLNKINYIKFVPALFLYY